MVRARDELVAKIVHINQRHFLVGERVVARRPFLYVARSETRKRRSNHTMTLIGLIMISRFD